MKFKLIFILFCFISLNIYAQGGTIKGIVIDKESLEVLIGVNVIILGTKLGVATDTTGNYEIKNIAPGTYDVKVAYLGYTSITLKGARVTNSSPLILDFELEKDSTLPSIMIIDKTWFEKIRLACTPPWTVDMIPIKEFYFINMLDSFKNHPPELKPVVVEHPNKEN